MKEFVVPIKGMHCRSCEIMLTDALEQLPDVRSASVSLKSKTATIRAVDIPPRAAMERVIRKAGYDIGYDEKSWLSKNPADYKDVFIGLVVVAIIGFIVSKMNIGKSPTGSVASGGLVVPLLIGLTAGFSTCMALVGGLVLGISAKHSRKHPSATTLQRFRPHLYFNVSRIVAFALFGGIIGSLGSIFQLQGPALGFMTVAVGIVMLMLGLQLTNLFPRLSNGGLTLPSGLARRLGIHNQEEKEYSHRTAMGLGAASFFLPCGFTQAMQLYAISTGSFKTGALVMGLFALGTAPGLLGVGGLTSVVEGRGAKRFFKIAGVAVAAMAILNISNGYNLTGFPRPFASTEGTQQAKGPEVTATVLTGPIQKLKNTSSNDESNRVLRAQYTVASGMVPNRFNAKAGQTYTLEVTPLEDGVGCMSTILIPGLNNNVQYLEKGKVNKLKFKATRGGVYQVTCAMGVPHGKITVS